MEQVDAIVVGAGVVGLAVGRALSSKLDNVLVLDKNSSFGEETSSRNSEVIHAGLYYPTDSLKAKLCVEGKKRLYQYCHDRKVPHKRVGKLVVATSSSEVDYLSKLKHQAEINGVNDLTLLNTHQVKEICPLVSAHSALLSPSTGIIDTHSLMVSFIADIEANNGMFVGQSEVIAVKRKGNYFTVSINTSGEVLEVSCRYLINSAGLHSTKLASKIAELPKKHIPTLHYCRGHYFSYQGKSPFNQLIYPVPSENGLGIHASLDVGGQLKFGPDTEYIDSIDYRIPLALKDKFVKAIKRYYPSLNAERLQPAYSGIRPKLQGENDEFADFIIQGSDVHGIDGLINLFGIDSPGLTSSMAIGELVKDKVLFL